MSDVTLYDYWRSSASYRVRIALELAGIAYDKVGVNLLDGAQRQSENLARNPQGLVPTLEIDGQAITQSLAIIEYLDETRPDLGFMPKDSMGRARVRQLSYVIAMETHPVCNLSVSSYAVDQGGGNISMESWMQHFIPRGLSAFEKLLDDPATGKCCHGDTVTMADMCLIPQVFNAKRWKLDLAQWPNIARISAYLDALPAFEKVYPQDTAGG